MRIDAHQHFWNYNPATHPWITEEMKKIQRDFLPEELVVALRENSMEGSVAVQADQTENETQFLIDLARQNSFIKGVVGWVDLRAPDLEQRLQYFSQFKVLKGFRHIVQTEADDFLLQKDFCRGIGLLNKYNFTFDILIYPRQLPFALHFVHQFPKQKFVIDHLAKPNIKKKEIADWKSDIELISRHTNVYCKVSGMVTEADWRAWRYEDLVPCLDVVVRSFGLKRIMYGSDWPVCLVASTYRDQLIPYQRYFERFSARDQEGVFGNNVCEFYNLQA